MIQSHDRPQVLHGEDLEAHAAYLRRLARSLARDETLVEEAVQDTWLRLFERPPAASGSLRAWLSVVLRNRIFEIRRRDRRRADLLEVHAGHMSAEQDARRDEPRADGLDALGSSAASRLEEHLQDALTRLSDEQREVLALSFQDGLKTPAIAQALGLPVETVRTRKKRALARLRTELGAPSRRTAEGNRARRASGFLVGLFRRAWEGLAVRRGALPALALVAGTAITLGVLLDTPERHEPAARPVQVAGLEGLDDEVPGAGTAESGHLLRDPLLVPEQSSSARSAADEDAPVSAEDRTTGTLHLRSTLLQAGHRSPLPGLDLLVLRSRDSLRSQNALRLQTDERGELELELAPGQYQVLPQRGSSVSVRIAENRRRELQLTADPGRRLVGRVVDAYGRPARAATLHVSWPRFPARTRASGTVDGNGAFRLEAVDPQATVFARGADGTTSLGLQMRSPALDAKNLEPEVELKLSDPLERVAGRLLSEDGAPLADGRLQVLTFPFRTRTDADGWIWANGYTLAQSGPDGDFEAALPPGEQLVFFAEAKGRAGTRHTVARSRLGRRLDLRMPAQRILAGRIVDAAGAGVRGVELVATPAPPLLPVRAQSQRDGRFRLEGVAAQALDLAAWHPGAPHLGSFAARFTFEGTRVRRDDSTRTTSATDLELELGLGHEVHGRALDVHGNALPGWRIVLDRTSRRAGDALQDGGIGVITGTRRVLRADATGAFRFPAVLPGPHQLRLLKPGTEDLPRGREALVCAFQPELQRGFGAWTLRAAAPGSGASLVLPEAPLEAGVVALDSHAQLGPLDLSAFDAGPDGSLRIDGLLPGPHRLLRAGQKAQVLQLGGGEVRTLGRTSADAASLK